MSVHVMSVQARHGLLALRSKNAGAILPHATKPIDRGSIPDEQFEELAWKPSGKPLTKRELADFLGVSERFFELKINRGRLRAVRLSHRLLRFRQIDVER